MTVEAERRDLRPDMLVVRPYDERFRAQIMALLHDGGFTAARPHVVEPGTPDGACADVIRRVAGAVDVLLIPFHSHRASDDTIVDGFGPLLLLDDETAATLPPVVMPVADFSFAGSFARRREEFAQRHPELDARLVIVVAAALREPHARARVVTALHRAAGRTPP